MIYVQFLKGSTELLGSDGRYILDGRNKLTTTIQDAKDRARALRHVKDITGFTIIKTRSLRNTGRTVYTTEL